MGLGFISESTEFWSAIGGALAGALVGGLIAYFIQRQALNEARRQRVEDRRSAEQALAHSLLFKMARILSDFHGIRDHFEKCFREAKEKGLEGEPWSFVLPLGNAPEPIHFQADEMGMLLAQKDDDTFDAVVSMDIVHNSLIEAVKLFSVERRALAERLKPEEASGSIVTGSLDRDQALVLRPRQIEVNSLIEAIRDSAAADFKEATDALERLSSVLRERLGLHYQLTLTVESPRDAN